MSDTVPCGAGGSPFVTPIILFEARLGAPFAAGGIEEVDHGQMVRHPGLALPFAVFLHLDRFLWAPGYPPGRSPRGLVLFCWSKSPECCRSVSLRPCRR